MAEDHELSQGGARPPRSRSRDARLVATGVVAVLLTWFALANLQQVTIHFWLVTARSPLIVVVAIAGVLGAAAARLAGRRRRRGRGPGRRVDALGGPP
ncbi:MAG TPA: hypothetical protein VKV36_01080 [Acidimicrobiales bacterium]|nr:hypothetical protein [Acidimicrobiales bacterium]